MTKMMAKVLLGAALVCGWAGAAEATIVYATFSSTIHYGADPNGQFGTPTADLSGKTLKLQYRFDLGAGGSNVASDFSYANYYGGSRNGFPAIATVTVSVDKASRKFQADAYDVIQYGSNRGIQGLSNSGVVADVRGGYYERTTGIARSPLRDTFDPQAIGAPLDYVTPIYNSEVDASDGNGFFASSLFGGNGYDTTLGNPVHVVITSTSGVPEPASLAALGLGAGLIAVGRRLRKA